MIDTRTISLADIAPNTGQISGVPANPRIIQDGRFTKLVRSLKDDPEMMELRELLVYEQDGAFVVIGGNMRLKALKHIGATEAPCKVIPSDWPAEKLRAIATKDNVSFGEFDWSQLTEAWDKDELDVWGVEFPVIFDFGKKNKEIDVEALDGQMELRLKYSEADYWKVRNALDALPVTHEQAVFQLLKL